MQHYQPKRHTVRKAAAALILIATALTGQQNLAALYATTPPDVMPPDEQARRARAIAKLGMVQKEVWRETAAQANECIAADAAALPIQYLRWQHHWRLLVWNAQAPAIQPPSAQCQYALELSDADDKSARVTLVRRGAQPETLASEIIYPDDNAFDKPALRLLETFRVKLLPPPLPGKSGCSDCPMTLGDWERYSWHQRDAIRSRINRNTSPRIR